MLPSNFYGRDYGTVLWLNSYFGNFIRSSHVTLSGETYTLSSWNGFKGYLNCGAERAKARCPLLIAVTDLNRSASAPKKQNPPCDGASGLHQEGNRAYCDRCLFRATTDSIGSSIFNDEERDSYYLSFHCNSKQKLSSFSAYILMNELA